MKRSNLLLAATTGLLAIASFAFAKTREAKGQITGYCKNSGSALCPTATHIGHFRVPTDDNYSKCADQRTVVTNTNCSQKLVFAGN